MKIIEIKSLDNGAHRNQSGNFAIAPDGWAVIPDDITIPSSFPFVNIEAKDGVVINITEGILPACSELTHEKINAMVVSKIREKYDINAEFKMINLGIVDPKNEDYVAYRNYVQECVDWGNALEGDGDS